MMAKKIEVHTTIRAIHTAGYIKPLSQMWVIVNDGNNPLVIDHSFKVFTYGGFGVNADVLTSEFLDKGILVENTTQYHIDFASIPNTSFLPDNSARLIETFVKLVDG